MASLELESFVERTIAVVESNELAQARAEFEARTGRFEPGDPFYEERIRAFLDWLCIDWDGGSVLRRFALQAGARDRALAAALRASMRSLWKVHPARRTDRPILECLLHGARFEVRRAEAGTVSRLRPGDVLDGRVVAIDGAIVLMPGAIFHPPEAHQALERLLDEAGKAGRRDATLLDSLLRMRMRFDRFHSIHARHIYRFDALDHSEVLAAPWAANRSRADRGPLRPPIEAPQ